jgi:hypothetical protein
MLIASDDLHKSTPISRISNALYIQDSVPYWLTYYHADDGEDDFLQAIKYSDLSELSGNKGYTIFDGDEIVLLARIKRQFRDLTALFKPCQIRSSLCSLALELKNKVKLC